ncbi:MAG: hypothetical protein ACXAC8_18060 [Candidatus Hodarchaeales archaeon]|jgi:hypothetical protein
MSYYDEYTNLLTEFITAVEDELLQYMRGLILFGSYRKEQKEPGWIIPGTSDLDLVLIVDLDDPNPIKPPKRLSKISEALSVFFTHPVYAPILDLTILESSDLPAKLGMDFSPIHSMAAAKQGEVLLGKNVLEDFSFSEKLLNRCAKIRVNQGYETIKNGYLHKSIMVEHHLCQDFSEIILDMAHATIAATGIFNLVRPEVPEKFDLILGDIFAEGVDIIYEAKKYRMGSQKMQPSDFLSGSIQLAQALMKYLRNPFNQTSNQ